MIPTFPLACALAAGAATAFLTITATEAAAPAGGPQGSPPPPPQTFVQTIPGTDLSFEMVRVPGGASFLGSPSDEPGRDDDEGPQRSVTLSPFWIGVHEVTNAHYAVFKLRDLDNEATSDPDRRLDVDAVTRPSPPYEDPTHGMNDRDRPATGMTQWAALQYARWLSEKTGRLYRLPTEAEWEHACRAGSTTARPAAGDTVRPRPGEVADSALADSALADSALAARAWYIDNSGEVTHPVGTKAPNPWGIHDMLGNAAEWTLDFYDAGFYLTLEDGSADPASLSEAVHPRTVRGGAFDDPAADLRCAARIASTLAWKRRDPQLPGSRWWNTDSPHVGFRLVSPDAPLTLEEIRDFWEALPGG